MVRLSINQSTSKQWTLEEDVFYYNQFHFHGAGLWQFKVGDFGVEKTRELLEENQLSASSLSYVGGFTGCEDTWAGSVRSAISLLQSAHELGASNVILVSGARNRHIASHAQRCLIQALERMLPIAQEFGIRLLLQPELESVSRHWNFIHDWNSLFRVIDKFPSQDVGFVLNTYHASFLNEIWELLPNRIHQLGLVQISDSVNLPRLNRRRDDCLLGQGVLMPDHRLRQILGYGYDGWIEVEVLGPTWGREGYRHVLEASEQFATEFMASLPLRKNLLGKNRSSVLQGVHVNPDTGSGKRNSAIQ